MQLEFHFPMPTKNGWQVYAFIVCVDGGYAGQLVSMSK